MESLNKQFVEMEYIPWKNNIAKTNAMKLSLIFQVLVKMPYPKYKANQQWEGVLVMSSREQ